ncbi:DNA glycosylase and apyrimidinic (AP) lyase (endonuclease III) [Candidatus Methylopumilus planktonicus]|jgi:endonuclease-3|uniref:Endonuclease III n=1 Tax=Candidatus Methylopumilus planktonicus TaxID=1581557 RepID=A0A0D6EX52_9PROT|nr:endonuclease III [Candidatus Methylopumilus planktonicus]GBL32922.1 endonuclease III [Methylophilaceae bacterium]QDD07292.1 endonuclease III [Candidatus Methylopumilus planktonicus]QDD08621.1 endonuclease III [Candidatus Methylopumilus planktonicus]QDD09944.1 endonuclease III [Candidatus Methylopumilus planktonicus]CEZ20029.1 DNA glycosylase and apyrimidinic (AP) lyase (endonuclease III) [Candidatus Methylopumilus planktonicus]
MNPQKRFKIFELLSKATPHPTTELIYQTPFQLLISVILSAQATDKSVNKATLLLFNKAPNAKRLAQMQLKDIELCIKTIGLYKTKAKNILETAKIIDAEFEGLVPQDRLALEALPGVGRKTANVILNTIFHEPTIAVDTHIFRIANRINLAPGENVLQVEKKLIKLTPKEFLQDAHHLLILHGRYTCIARQPKCNVCVIYDLCEYKKKLKN